MLKSSSQVSGTSTAAAIWSTGAVGIAVGLERIEIAIALSVMTFVTLKIIGKVKNKIV
ncbi:MgtC/SapB family protein [Rheinheimera sp. MMS21-TC3]|nr:MgtC/SapB family protein [Rheinheimera sp. MMS21-TC3]WNO62256.1 MgtC/SapB family protein [Rheinheimera sp. MMS21-TC3]